MSKTKTEDAVAVIDDAEFAVMRADAQEAVEAVQDNLRGSTLNRFDLVKVKVPGAGVTDWTIEEADGNKLVKSFEGIILHWHDARAYYEPKFDSTGNEIKEQTDDPPDCSSEDAIYGEPLGECAACPKSKWPERGSARKSQECRLRRVLYILQKGAYLPVVLEAPPTSYGSVKDYYMSLSKDGIPSSGVVTDFSLTREESSGGFKYAKIVPKVARVLNADEKSFVRQYADTFKKSLSQ